jgi:pimeloyl-ACP methyl ester carboxylesterase
MILYKSASKAKPARGWIHTFSVVSALTLSLMGSTIRTVVAGKLDPLSSPQAVREDAFSWFHPRNLDAIEAGKKAPMKPGHPLRLALKHYSRPGAQPILMIHGLAQNDRGLDAHEESYNFALFLFRQGYDVWIGNMRSAGTPGFKSETPEGPHHWTVDDYAVDDLPALVKVVREKTGKEPFLLGHSLGAWMIDGYLAGLEFDRFGYARPNPELQRQREASLKGVITVAGLYGVYWENTLDDAWKNPIRSEQDYYHSNYELELLAQADLLYKIIPELPAFPLNWIGTAFNLPLKDFPLIGDQLEKLYRKLQTEAIDTPVLSMFMYPPNTDPEMLQDHVRDGMEDLGPKLLQQIANARNCGARMTFHSYKNCPSGKTAHLAYRYDQARESSTLPTLFVAGNQDRLASAHQILNSGLKKTASNDKSYLLVEGFGHLDILSGIHAQDKVMKPVADWMKKRTP